MKSYLFFLMLFFSGWMFAQNTQIIEASVGEDMTSKVSTQMQYLFPEFSDGLVFNQNSTLSSGKLNYNTLVGEMQFLNNDVVLALNAKDIAVVNINSRQFFPYKGNEFTEELLSSDIFNLRVRRKGNAAPYARKGAYGMSSSTSSITSISSISGGDGRMYDLSVTEDIIVSVRYYYYLVGKNGKYIQISNVKTFTKQFPAFRKQIEEYAKENMIRFDNADDLKKLLVYCIELN